MTNIRGLLTPIAAISLPMSSMVTTILPTIPTNGVMNHIVMDFVHMGYPIKKQTGVITRKSAITGITTKYTTVNEILRKSPHLALGDSYLLGHHIE